MSIISENSVSFFEFNFKSDNYNVKFNLEFGAGQDSKINENDSRMNYNIKDTFKMSELKFSNNNNTAFKVVGKEAPIVSKISNVQVYNNINDVIVKYNNNCSFFIGGVSIFNYLIENNLITNLYINIIHDKYNTNLYIDLDKLKSLEHQIISRQVFKEFTHLHISFVK